MVYGTKILLGSPNVERRYSELVVVSEQKLLFGPRSFDGVSCVAFTLNGFWSPDHGSVICDDCRNSNMTSVHEDVHAYMGAAVPERRFVMHSLTLEEPLAMAIARATQGGLPEHKYGFNQTVKDCLDAARDGELRFNAPAWADRYLYEGHYALINRLVAAVGVDDALEMMVLPITAAADGELEVALDFIRLYLSSYGVSKEEIEALDVGNFGPAYVLSGREVILKADGVELQMDTESDELVDLVCDTLGGILRCGDFQSV